MKKFFASAGTVIGKAIDFFHPPFRRYFSREFFRYGVCGAANIGFDWVLYFVTYNFIFRRRLIELGFTALTPHIAALLVTFPITLLSGFLLQKYVTFTASGLRGREQLVRYMAVVGVNLLINYFGLKLFVEILHFYPTLSKMLITVICTVFSYFSQKKFTFR